MTDYYTKESDHLIKIVPIASELLPEWLDSQKSSVANWVRACQYKAKPGESCLIPDQDGQLALVLLALSHPDDFWQFGGLPRVLPANRYLIDNSNNFLSSKQYEYALMAWGLGSYQFNAYVDREPYGAQLHIPASIQSQAVENLVATISLVRDLINMPAGDLGPDDLAEAAREIATESQAEFSVIVGDQLLSEGYPTIHAVGRGAAKAPRLIDFIWGDADAPKVTLVGKGVCFDSGGLDIKPADGMRDMKKDMGGAAHVLGLARLIMLAKLPVRLRVLIPAVENAVDANSYHPGDIIETRGGFTVEVDNTDAEGRLILCDALAEAVSEHPDYLVDFSTLTGAARIALGLDVAAMFTNNNEFSKQLLDCSEKVNDPVWRLPLHQSYRDLLKSDIADMLNSSKTRYGGAITAALFLQTYVPNDICWMHFDINGSNSENRPGRPVGGEAQGLRAMFEFFRIKFSG